MFEFTIESVEMAQTLREIDEKYQIDWFKPHRGKVFELGTAVQILTQPEDRADIAKVED